jgi:hypothetical protein
MELLVRLLLLLLFRWRQGYKLNPEQKMRILRFMFEYFVKYIELEKERDRSRNQIDGLFFPNMIDQPQSCTSQGDHDRLLGV